MLDKIKNIIGNKTQKTPSTSGRGLGGGLSQKTSSKVDNILSNLSDGELEKLVEEKLDYLKWLIKYSRACDLELVPSPAGLNTFACGLGKESEKPIGEYMNGKIRFHEIPENTFKPSKFYYDLKMLLESDTKSLGALGDHEIGHAQYTDYGDIVWINKRAQDLGLPISVISLFFNGAIEDPFIGRKVSKKGPNKKNMVEHLYKNRGAPKTSGEFDISKFPQVKQLETKMAYLWLNNDFPETYNMEIKVSDEIEKIFSEVILPNFDRMISPDIPNLERVIFKNSILFPILEDLAKKDLEKAMQMQKIQEMLKDMMNKKGEGEQDSSTGSEGQKEQEGQPQNSPLPPGEGQGVRDGIDKEGQGVRDGEPKEPTEEDLKKAQEEIDKMSEEDRKKLEKEVKNEIDKENLDKLNEQIPGLDWKQNEHGELEFKPKTQSEKEKKEAKKLEEKLEEAIDKHEAEIAKTEDLKKKVAEAKTKEEVDKINNETKGIKSGKLKEFIQSQIQGKKEQIEQERIRKVQDMIQQGFDEGEEKYFEDFVKLEEEIRPYVDDFIKALSDYIPKLRDYIYTGDYHTGVIYDIPKAGRKIRMGHYSIYGRKDDVESMEINLGISLSLDVSGSMEQNNKIQESLKLMVFLGIFCEKLGIPFYINTIGENTREIKGVQDEYINSKGNIMKSTLNLENATNMTETFENVQEVIADQKYKMPNTEFIPIIITDGVPTDKGQKLKETIDKFDGLDIVFGLNLDDSEKETTKKYFQKGKKIFLDDATKILDKGKQDLIDYLVDNKDRIFTITE